MGAMAVTVQHNLPAWAALRGLKIEPLRRFLAKRPDLVELGVLHGPMRLYTEQAIDAIEAAFAARTDGRKAKTARA
jgi:hypothetical protein